MDIPKPKTYNRRDKKSRSGCQVCKAKRIRCDESRPECLNCVRKGRLCPGYQVTLSWSSKHERRQPRKSQYNVEPIDFEQLASTAIRAIGQQTRDPVNAAPSVITPRSTTSSVQATTPSTTLCQDELDLGDVASEPFGQHGQPHVPDVFPQTTENFYLASDPATHEFLVDDDFQNTVLPLTNCLDFDILSTVTSQDQECPQSDCSQSTCSVAAFAPMHLQIERYMATCGPRPGLTDLPSSLVQHWFASVCCYWSAFDSDNNPFRSVASSLWGSSRSVFYSLQSMSAAALVENLPEMKQLTSSTSVLAVEAINEELVELYTSSSDATHFPKGLILALFCMGPSMCWDQPQRTGSHFFRQAKRLLRHFERRSKSLTLDDRQLLKFFRGCLKYEEMLRNVTGEEGEESSSTVQFVNSDKNNVSISPHPWTGVSPDLLALFGYAISLSRKGCLWQVTNSNVWSGDLQEVLEITSAAQNLEEILLNIESSHLDVHNHQYSDPLRWAHLRDATEAYRLASLLHLYQTFPDLIARRIPDQIKADGRVPSSVWLIPLALHLTRLLQKIPSSSDLRCILPLLYLSAGSCLRYEETSDSIGQPVPDSEYVLNCFSLASDPSQQESVSSPVCLDITTARHLVLERLSQLEQLLPPRPIRIAKQLTTTMWSVFDREIAMPHKSHWLNIMATTGLKTIFG